jgi:hypothetical protein
MDTDRDDVELSHLRDRVALLESQRTPLRWRGCRRLTFLAAALAAVAVIAGVAYATVPDANGVIRACRDTRYGYVRIIDTGSGGACTSGETAVAWASGRQASFYAKASLPVSVPAGQSLPTASVFCDGTDVATGGGFTVSPGMVVEFSVPQPTSGITSGWLVGSHNPTAGALNISANVVCEHVAA